MLQGLPGLEQEVLHQHHPGWYGIRSQGNASVQYPFAILKNAAPASSPHGLAMRMVEGAVLCFLQSTAPGSDIAAVAQEGQGRADACEPRFSYRRRACNRPLNVKSCLSCSWP